MSPESTSAVQSGSETSPLVLVAIHDPMISLDLEHLLKLHGCRLVALKDSVADALAVVHGSDVDIAIIDFTLQDEPVINLAKALDARGIPFGLCTGRPLEEVSERYPYTPVLHKPFGAEDVARIVDSLMAARLARG